MTKDCPSSIFELYLCIFSIIEKCLEEQPEKRYESTKELIKDLNNIYKYDTKYKSLVRRKYITIVLTIVFLGAFTFFNI